ncbi:MAG: mechanosensitive ion channel family protein [Acidimicrobiales bacterium]|nr:mechanosensitive ion channel family protein [Acidimicrobiales bacterium]HJL98951.1 mechanosensitive ion channel family protein [Acidimicrobiales bacterium]
MSAQVLHIGEPKLVYVINTFSSMAATLNEACGTDPAWLCRKVFEWTDNSDIAGVATWLVDRPVKVAVIALLALIIRRVVHRAIDGLIDRLMAERSSEEHDAVEAAEAATGTLRRDLLTEKLASLRERTERARQRAKTLGVLFKSIASAVIGVVTIMMLLGEFDINLGPLIAGAGIVGVAIGFGSQALVGDLLSGIFMLIEDQYGVGDVIDAGDATGTVESVGLRTTRIRDVRGTLWHIPNGQIRRVGNMSQVWARAILDIDVAYDTDLDLAMETIKTVADGLWEDQLEEATIVEEPVISGVQNFGADAVTIRLSVRTEPSEQWSTGRVLRKRIKEAFDEAGIEIPFPQRTVWLKSEADQKDPVKKEGPGFQTGMRGGGTDDSE